MLEPGRSPARRTRPLGVEPVYERLNRSGSIRDARVGAVGIRYVLARNRCDVVSIIPGRLMFLLQALLPSAN